MKTDTREQKDFAYDLMERIGIAKPLIGKFAADGQVYYFDNYHAFPVKPLGELNERKCKFELENACTVYAITHEIVDFDEWYTLLFIPNDDSEWDTLIQTKDGVHFMFVYVINMHDDAHDEYGYAFIKAKNGGIKRIA